MADDLFSFVAGEIEASTSLDRLESRGTLRILLKTSGLDAKTVTPEQFCVILRQVAPEEFESRGVAGAKAICAAVAEKVQSSPDVRWEGSHDVDQIFDRLAAG
jgi:hypothetical protein